MSPTLIIALAIAAALAAFLVFSFASRRRGAERATLKDDERSAAVDAWLVGALTEELCQGVESLAGERERVRSALHGDPDPSIVTSVEDAVRGVELEFLRYAHEEHADVIAHVRYEGGKTGEARGRVAVVDLPVAVSRDLAQKSTMRVFRPWVFPWAR